MHERDKWPKIVRIVVISPIHYKYELLVMHLMKMGQLQASARRQ